MNVSCPQCSTIYRVDPAKVPQGGVRARCSTCSGVIPVGIRTATPARPSPEIDAIGAAFGNRPPAPPPPFNPAQSRASVPVRQTPVPQARQTPATPVRAVPATPVAAPRVPTPAAPAPALGAALPPLRPTPRTPWQPVTEPVAPISVPPVTPPSTATRTATPARPAPAVATPAAPPTAATEPPSRRPINPFLSRDPSLRAKRLARALVSDMVAYYPAKHAEGLEKGTLKELFRDEIKKSYDEYVAQVGADFARSTTHFQESLNEVLGAGKKIF
jgi:predicted Zn finger-like uncharacterized protein